MEQQVQVQAPVMTPEQVAAATAGQQVQQLIVPEEDYPAYRKYIEERYPNVQMNVTPISNEEIKTNLESGKAMQLPKGLGDLLGAAVAYDPRMGFQGTNEEFQKQLAEHRKKKAEEAKQAAETTNQTQATNSVASPQTGQPIQEGQLQSMGDHKVDNLGQISANYDIKQNVPNLIGNISNLLAKYAEEEMKMENQNNNNQAAAAQGQAQAAMPIQMPEVSWGSIGKGVGLLGGGVLLGRYVFGKSPAPAEGAEALMSAAKTLGDADPKAIASAAGTVAKGLIGKVFGV